MKVGKIVIKDKIWFEYHGLGKPFAGYYDPKLGFENAYYEDMEKYKASKQLVEVENAVFDDLIEYVWIVKIQDEYLIPEDNQLCKAEVKDNKAVIMKLIKE